MVKKVNLPSVIADPADRPYGMVDEAVQERTYYRAIGLFVCPWLLLLLSLLIGNWNFHKWKNRYLIYIYIYI